MVFVFLSLLLQDMTTLTPIAHQNNNDGDGEGKHEFGAGIKFNIDVWPGSDESFLSDSEEEGVPAKEFNLLYAGPKKNELGHGSQRQESGLRDGQDAVVGSFWLQKQVVCVMELWHFVRLVCLWLHL